MGQFCVGYVLLAINPFGYVQCQCVKLIVSPPLTELDLIKDQNGTQGLYWCVNYPWPMSNRDVSLLSKATTDSA